MWGPHKQVTPSE
jgi:hypothetical protein